MTVTDQEKGCQRQGRGDNGMYMYVYMFSRLQPEGRGYQRIHIRAVAYT
jgi:hypothetical protein